MVNDMPTVTNMISGTAMMFRSAAKDGTLFSSSNNNLLGGSTNTFGSNNRTQNSISTLWSNYNSSLSNASSGLSGLSEIRGNVSSLVRSYDDTKNNFYRDFDETMENLSNNAANIRNYNFNVGENALTTTESVNDKGETVQTTTRSQELNDAIKAVSDFAKSYNSAIDFFANNNDVSKRVGRMQTMFADTTYRSANYNAIGLNIGSDGKITIDEDKLAQTIANDPSRVSNVLGRDGLSGKADSHVSTANSMRSRLFPSAKTLIGNDLSAASLYTGNAYRNITSYSNVGNLVNMMF